jgi:hypothetical protein
MSSVCAVAVAARLPPRRAAMRRNWALRYVSLPRTADRAAIPRVALSHLLPGRVCPGLALPPVLLLPGQTPAQDARCLAVVNRLMLTPISAMMTSAARLGDAGNGVQELNLALVGLDLGGDPLGPARRSSR